jgi:hypothetical protein
MSGSVVAERPSYRFVRWLSLIAFFALALRLAGAVILRRRRVILLPLTALAVSVTVGVAVTYGFTRFRAAAEVAIVLLAAVAVDAGLRTGGSTRDQGDGPSRPE